MSSNLALPAEDLKDLREVAADIAGFPPLEEWIEIRQIIAPQNAVNTQLYWNWLGRSLDAFFSDRPDPLAESNLSETLQAVIQSNSNRYIILSLLIFQGEKFLRQEAQALGFDYPFTKRSDLLKELALEDCRFAINLSLQKHWESHSERQRSERLRDTQKSLQSGTPIKTTQLKRWAKEDAKLHRDGTLSVKTMPWMCFCVEVFSKYSKKLPAYSAFIDTLGIPEYGHVKKFAILNREFKPYPGRGSSKQAKSS